MYLDERDNRTDQMQALRIVSHGTLQVSRHFGVSEEFERDGGAGFSVGEGVVVVEEGVAAGGSDGVELMVGKAAAEVAAGKRSVSKAARMRSSTWPHTSGKSGASSVSSGPRP